MKFLFDFSFKSSLPDVALHIYYYNSKGIYVLWNLI